MQTQKSQPEGKLIMPETRFTEFPVLFVDPRVGISRSALETNDFLLFFLPIIRMIEVLKEYLQFTLYDVQLGSSAFFRMTRKECL